MAARTVEIVDAMVDYLNGLTLSQTFNAEKKLVVSEDLHEVQSLQVYVIPAPLTSTVTARNYEEEIHQINIAVMREANEITELETMLSFKQEIADAIRLKVLTSGSNTYRYAGQNNDPQYSNELASTKALFMSVLQVRYKTLVEGV